MLTGFSDEQDQDKVLQIEIRDLFLTIDPEQADDDQVHQQGPPDDGQIIDKLGKDFHQ